MRCFEVLEDPRALRRLVVGTRKVRRFDPRWPDPGSTVLYRAGVFPLFIRDRTQILECEPGRRLVLDARASRVGRFRVEFRFEADRQDGTAGTKMTVDEDAVDGVAARPSLRGFVDPVTVFRNRVLCRRFRRMVEEVEERHLRGDGEERERRRPRISGD